MPAPSWKPSRRGFLTGAMALAGTAALPGRSMAISTVPPRTTVLTAQETPHHFPGRSAATPLWSYDGSWPAEIRIRRGETVNMLLRNQLKDHTAIHWHGVRVPWAMDGVPYITQAPVKSGEEFLYNFAAPDPGTFFFHPHCMTTEALGRGLAGALIVEDPREDGLFDLDQTLVAKDWRVDKDGKYLPFMTDRGAARAGTFGTLRTVNGGEAPVISAPPGARVRLRLLNVDVTRIMQLGAVGAPVSIIATDGNACAPMPIAEWRLGPAMRADLALVMPAKPGAKVQIQDLWGQEPFALATLVAEGTAKKTDRRPLALPAAELPVADPKNAANFELWLQMGASDPALDAWLRENTFGDEALCRAPRLMWAINDKSWPAMDPDKRPDPLAELKTGKSYTADIVNRTQHAHPVHLHGHTFRVEASNRGTLRPHWADTVLVYPDERVRISFVAGQSGDWMLHCHIIEHQETGMMGYVRVV